MLHENNNSAIKPAGMSFLSVPSAVSEERIHGLSHGSNASMTTINEEPGKKSLMFILDQAAPKMTPFSTPQKRTMKRQPMMRAATLDQFSLSCMTTKFASPILDKPTPNKKQLNRGQSSIENRFMALKRQQTLKNVEDLQEIERRDMFEQLEK